jgi:hypothetical protein
MVKHDTTCKNGNLAPQMFSGGLGGKLKGVFFITT